MKNLSKFRKAHISLITGVILLGQSASALAMSKGHKEEVVDLSNRYIALPSQTKAFKYFSQDDKDVFYRENADRVCLKYGFDQHGEFVIGESDSSQLKYINKGLFRNKSIKGLPIRSEWMYKFSDDIYEKNEKKYISDAKVLATALGVASTIAGTVSATIVAAPVFAPMTGILATMTAAVTGFASLIPHLEGSLKPKIESKVKLYNESKNTNSWFAKKLHKLGFIEENNEIKHKHDVFSKLTCVRKKKDSMASFLSNLFKSREQTGQVDAPRELASLANNHSKPDYSRLGSSSSESVRSVSQSAR